jgi:2,3-bisphosphoglycerate-independent phosphoglycerate mutase
MSKKLSYKPVLLCILDGWGLGDVNNSYNAIARAKTPNYDRFLKNYPHSQLTACGPEIGLPPGQIGNSEVGHMTIGAGRVIFQTLPRINRAMADGSFEKNAMLQKMINNLQISQKSCHLLGLLSDGGVHCHIDHIIFLAELLVKNKIRVLLHIFLDGRDVAQKSALDYLEKISQIPALQTATICGRYYAMDRDCNWNRIKLAYEAIVLGRGQKTSDAVTVVKNSYAQGINDEFILPAVIGSYQGMADGDAILVCNFRADRARQICSAILDADFREFTTTKIKFSQSLVFTQYDQKLNHLYEILFPPLTIKNSLPEILAANNLKQLRLAETEKYAHVTFFFSCGREKPMPGESRILVNSPAVATYDLKPEMSAAKIGKKLCQAIYSGAFDFIIVNYANPDMVGHSGMLAPAIKACEIIDSQLGMLEKIILEKGGLLLLSADHGNIECMQDKNQRPHTAHTTNLVPLILIGQNVAGFSLKDGCLSDIAPTILHLMQLAKPAEMTGKNLIERK